MRQVPHVLLLLPLLAACGGDSGTGLVTGGLPTTFRLVGTADSTFADGGSISCQFAFSVIVAGEQDRTALWAPVFS